MSTRRPLPFAGRLLLALLCACGLLAVPAAGAPGDFATLGPQGGAVTALAPDPHTPRSVLAASDSGAVFRGLEGGLSVWVRVGDGIPSGLPGQMAAINTLAVDPFVPGRVYAGTSTNGFFVSTDGGVTWVQGGSGPALGVRRVVPDPLVPGRMLVVSGAGVHRSTTSGASFAPAQTGLPAPLDVADVAFDPITAGRAFAAGSGGRVWRTVDGGDSWQPLGTGLPAANASITGALAVEATTPRRLHVVTSSGLYLSVDGGAQWVPAGVGLPNDGVTVRRLAVAPGAPGTLYAGTSSGAVHVSVDGGLGWTSAGPGLDGTHVYDLVTVAASPHYTVVATDAGTDTRLVSGWNGASPVATSVSALSSGTGPGALLFAATGDGVFASPVPGSWERRSTGLPAVDVSASAVAPSAPAQAYAGTDGSGIFRTTDAGANWTPASAGLPADGVGTLTVSVAVHPTNPLVAYAGVASWGVYRTSDGGASWHPVGSASFAPTHAIAYDPSEPTRMYLGRAVGVLRSTDGGVNWTSARAGLGEAGAVRAVAVDPTDSNRVYAGTDHGLYRSVDGGTTWTGPAAGIPDLAVHSVLIDPAATAAVFAGTQGGAGVYASTDHGATWAADAPGLGTRDVRALAFPPSAERDLAAGTHGGGVWDRVLPVVDQDGDGLLDLLDACPGVPGPASNAGCPAPPQNPDTDGDGVPNLLDACPTAPGPASNAGCPTGPVNLDPDGDGVLDPNDFCPTVPGPTRYRGCPPPGPTAGDDQLFGTTSVDRLRGLGGDDRLAGLAGNDRLEGGRGDDRLLGGTGHDVLLGGAGDDLLQGGTGQDTLFGGTGDDRLVGGPGLDRYFAGPGDDLIDARDGLREAVRCGPGRDRVRADRRDLLLGCEVRL